MFSIAALKEPGVGRIVAGQFISQISDKLMLVAAMWLIADKYEAIWIPWFVAAGGIPHLLFATISGKWIARWGVLHTVIGTQFWRAAVLLAFPLLLTDANQPPIISLITLTFLINLAAALFNPAILTLPIQMVREEQRPQVNAMIDGCFALGNVIGPVLSVGLFAALGLKGLIWVNGACYLLAALLQFSLLSSSSRSAQEQAADQNISPWTILGREALVRRMLITFLAINLFGTPFVMYIPLYVKHVYQLQLSALATLETSFGLGAVTGAIFLSLHHFAGKLGPRIIASILVFGGAYIAFAASRELAMGAVALFLMGGFLSAANVWILTLFQSVVKPYEVPAVMGIVNLISVATLPVSMAIFGLLVDRVEVTLLAIVSALAVFVVGLVLPLIPRLKEV